MSVRLLAAIPLVAFLVLATFFVWGLVSDRDPSALPSVLINQPVPAFELPSLGESQAALSQATLTQADLSSGEVALVNFFASWCVPCRIEHPHFMTLSTESSLPIYGIAWRDAPEDTKRWLDALGDPYRKIGVDFNNQSGLDFGLAGVPETFVVDKSGTIQYRHVGPIDVDVLNQTIIPLIVELRKQPG